MSEAIWQFQTVSIFRLLAFTGCRKSEVLALQWKDLDITNKSVHIGKTVAKDEFNNILVQTPKTSSSTRSISLDNETLKIMAKWRSIQRSDYFQMGFNTSSEEQYIFTNNHNELLSPNVVNIWLNCLIKKYDLPRITPHHFRHTHASLLLQSGVPIKEVAERLGHTSTAITDRIYSHVMPEEKEKTADKFAQFVGF